MMKKSQSRRMNQKEVGNNLTTLEIHCSFCGNKTEMSFQYGIYKSTCENCGYRKIEKLEVHENVKVQINDEKPRQIKKV
jgi:ribosomal protein L37E